MIMFDDMYITSEDSRERSYPARSATNERNINA